MSRRYYDLPPLTTLAAFETAARHLSFKHAAQELSVTPGAVSHQIKALEGELGAPLFRRRHRGVELTAEGESLYESLASSFAKVAQCVKGIRDRHSGNKVTVGSTSAVASLWLSPSVIRFWHVHPDVDVNQSIQEEQFAYSSDVDLYIRYGQDPDARMAQTALFRDRLVPVGNRAQAARLADCTLEELAGQRLIHLETPNKSWTTWREWFYQLGHDGPIAPGIRVNNYSVALQAAQDGAGLALGWRRLVRPLLEEGRLHPIGWHAMAAPQRYYLVARPEEELSGAAQRLRDWIVREVDAKTSELN